jgi:hypothetical protein
VQLLFVETLANTLISVTQIETDAVLVQPSKFLTVTVNVKLPPFVGVNTGLAVFVLLSMAASAPLHT